ncbi:MAG: hypothetical protein IPP63_19710 [Chloracidobacterium sp.]|nr:hypothetical protein [Chloracidobacterium sp.]
MTEIVIQEAPAVTTPPTIREAWLALLHEPSLFIRHWNYKGAILSSAFRAPIFLITYLRSRESLKLACGGGRTVCFSISICGADGISNTGDAAGRARVEGGRIDPLGRAAGQPFI